MTETGDNQNTWVKGQIVGAALVKAAKTPTGRKKLKDARNSFLQTIARVLGWLLAAGLLHLLFGRFTWYDRISTSETIAASVLQAVLALAALFGSYFLFNRAQSAEVYRRCVILIDDWQRRVAIEATNRASDFEWLSQRRAFDEQAERVRRAAHTYQIAGLFDFNLTTRLRELAPPGCPPDSSWPHELELMARATVARVAAHVPQYKAVVVAIVALAALVIPAWNTPGLSLVLLTQTLMVGFHVVLFFAEN